MRALFLALTALVCLAAQPAAAQSYYFPTAGGGGPVTNASTTLERLTPQVASGTGVNGKGPASPSLGTTASNWSGFHAWFYNGSNAAARMLCDVSFNGGSTWAVQNLYLQPNTSAVGTGAYYFVPVTVPAASNIVFRCQSSASGSGVILQVTGEVATSTRAPGFTTMTALNVDTTNGRADDADVTFTSASWTSLADPTPGAYSALIAAVGDNGGAPAANVAALVTLASGPTGGGSEAEIASFQISLTTTGGVPRRHISPVLPVSVASGARISAKVTPLGVTDTTTAVRIALYGLN